MRDLETVSCRLHSRSQPRYPRFTLCPDCRTEAPREARIVEIVVKYFSQREFLKFFVGTEYEIRMGSKSCRADVILLNTDENPVAIAECKRIGINPEDTEKGIDQLKSYLTASATPLGLFADDTNLSYWVFLANLGRNNFIEITRQQFEKGIGVSSRSDETKQTTRRNLRRV